VTGHALDPPLSPELVLVSPDPEERALVVEHTSPPLYVVPQDKIVPLQPDAAPPQQEGAPEPPAPVVVASASPPEWRLTVGGATVIAVAGLVVFGAGLIVGQYALPVSTSRSLASTVEPVAAQQPTPLSVAKEPPTAQPPASVASPVPRRPATTPTTAPARRPTTTAPARVETPASAVRPVPNGGYVLPDGRGRFRLSSSGRAIVDFTLDTQCGRVTLPQIGVTATGTFAFAGHPKAAPRGTIVRVEGRFSSPDRAKGTMEVTRTTCRDASVVFVAILS
jgi:hypothetical protein